MMSSKGWFLLQSCGGWRIAAADPHDPKFFVLECDGDVAADVLGQAVEAFLTDQGAASKNIVIGVSSTSAVRSGTFPKVSKTRGRTWASAS